MKINYWLIALLVLLSPSQLGIHFWPEWSLVDGIKIDFLSPTIYFTDLLFLGTLIISGFQFRKSKFIKLLGAIFLGLFCFRQRSNFLCLLVFEVSSSSGFGLDNLCQWKKLNFPVIIKMSGLPFIVYSCFRDLAVFDKKIHRMVVDLW